jgi:hypothetical protein
VEYVGREIPAVPLLETVPGIGSYRDLLIATETLPIERFHCVACTDASEARHERPLLQGRLLGLS